MKRITFLFTLLLTMSWATAMAQTTIDAQGGYYRLVNTSSTTNYMTVLDNGDGTYGLSVSNTPSAVNSVVQFIKTSTDGQYLMKLQGLYIGIVSRSNKVSLVASEDPENDENVGKFTVNLFSGTTDTYYFQDVFGNKDGNCLMGADIVQGWGPWTQKSRWYIYAATDIEVALSQVESEYYATTYLPFPVSSATEGVSIYTGALNGTKDVITMSEVTSLPAENGAVIVGSSASATFNILSETSADISNALSGTLLPVTLTDDTRANYLVFGRNTSTNELGFYKPSSSVSTIGYNKAFIDNSSSGANAITMSFGGSQTAIENAINGNMNNAPIYDLSGRHVMKTVKGNFYIQGGKKFIAQ